MRKLQNTLYITTQGSYLHKERETLVVEQERKKVAQLPVHSIGHIFCFGNMLASPFCWGFASGAVSGVGAKSCADCAQYHCSEDSGE